MRRLFSGRLAIVGAAVSLIAVVVAVAAPILSPHNPLKQNLANTLASPSRVHPLGTDNVGRDIFSRVIFLGFWHIHDGAVGLLKQRNQLVRHHGLGA